MLEAYEAKTGPEGYGVSLVLCRMLKVKERITSDRELSQSLAKHSIYRHVTCLSPEKLPAHNTFNTLRARLGAEGFWQIHQALVSQAHRSGLLNPRIVSLPKTRRPGIILVADSTFIKTVASTQGEKDEAGDWLFSDPTAAFGRPHHKHKYPVGHMSHSLATIGGVPLVSHVPPSKRGLKQFTRTRSLLPSLLRTGRRLRCVPRCF